MYLKLVVVIILIALAPIGLAWRNEYVTGFGFYATGFSPEVWGYGRLLTASIILVCIVCIVLGLIVPRLVVLVGSRTRKDALVIYGLIALSALWVFSYEIPFLTGIQWSHETENIRKLYGKVEPSMTLKEIERMGHEYSKYIRAFEKKDDGSAIQISYPSTFSILIPRETGILLIPSDYDASNIRHRKIILIENGKVVNTKDSHNKALEPAAQGGG